MAQRTDRLAKLKESQRAEARKSFPILRPFLEEGVPLTRIALEHQLEVSTLRRWVQRYRSDGLRGEYLPGRTQCIALNVQP